MIIVCGFVTHTTHYAEKSFDWHSFKFPFTLLCIHSFAARIENSVKILSDFPVGFPLSSLFQQHAWSDSGETGLYSQRINNIVMTQLLTGDGLYQLKHEKPSCRLSHRLNPSSIPEMPPVPRCCRNTHESTNTRITNQG